MGYKLLSTFSRSECQAHHHFHSMSHHMDGSGEHHVERNRHWLIVFTCRMEGNSGEQKATKLESWSLELRVYGEGKISPWALDGRSCRKQCVQEVTSIVYRSWCLIKWGGGWHIVHNYAPVSKGSSLSAALTYVTHGIKLIKLDVSCLQNSLENKIHL